MAHPCPHEPVALVVDRRLEGMPDQEAASRVARRHGQALILHPPDTEVALQGPPRRRVDLALGAQHRALQLARAYARPGVARDRPLDLLDERPPGPPLLGG